MNPRSLLRIEGLAVFAGSATAYFGLDGPLWLFLVLLLAPDLSMLGYLAGPRIGAAVYNAGHTYLLPAILVGAGLWQGVALATLLGLIWTAHIGADRALGYGLKYPDEFGHTHLGGERSTTEGTGPTVDPVEG